ncbi:HHIP-like protein 1 isoform X2 [Ruditapes philippinarum]|uniref:HHIP-like protein 1 isoform X2 n=1 Tax=Ruditapes philippinarum TaxID=129788 RepID=UPI00295B702B|nr:HHIP-like protein 1 isoform X2 [Ruditapes philippinarum]
MADSVKGVYANSVIIWILLSIYFVCVCEGHPQCLDSRPPFYSHSKLTFCTNYEDFGCCTPRDDLQLLERYHRISSLIPASQKNMWAQCSAFAKTFLCQTCSPYAAHIFDAEKSHLDTDFTLMPRAFPALCGPYCKDFYYSCKDLVKYYMEEVGGAYFEEAMRLDAAVNQNETEFCSKVAVMDKDYCYPELLSNPILNGNISIAKVSKEGCICMQPFAKNQFRNPIFLKHVKDGSNRLFVGEQIGLVHIMYSNGTILPIPFMNIQADVKTTNNPGDERGLLGMAFHPNYLYNGKLYIYYSTPLHDYEKNYGNHKIRIEELKRDPFDPNQIDYSYSRVILEVYEPWWNHNGGELLFGDDGYLYVFVGDGGRAGDPLRSGQNLRSMLGKVHRIDVDNVDLKRQTEYSIPPDNPFADGKEALPEIYAYGVRNIWRCGKDRGDPITKKGKGRILCGDVGQSAVEEIDLIEKGANYGWNLKEGTADYCPGCNRAKPEVNLTDPVAEYGHHVGKSVTGGHFYRGCESPNLNGYYIYGDFMSGKIFRLTEPKNPNEKKWDHKELNMCGSDWCVPPLTNEYETSIISFGEDEYGEVYMLSTKLASTSSYQGTVYKIVDPMRRGHPEFCESLRKPTSPGTNRPTTGTSQKTKKTSPYKIAPTTTPVYAGSTVSEAVLTGSSVTDQQGAKGTSSSFDNNILKLIQQWLRATAM